MKQLRTYRRAYMLRGSCGAFAMTEMLLIAVFAQPFNIRQGCLRKYQVLLVLIIYLIFCIGITSSLVTSRVDRSSIHFHFASERLTESA